MMGVVQTVEPATASPLRSLDRLFEAAKKKTIIQLRWPLVILCSYLLLYAPASWLTPAQTNAVLIFYLLTNATLYFVADDFFDSPYFYGPLLLFDTLFLVASLVNGGATADFYLACFFTLVFSCVCNDSRGLFIVTLLAPALYAYAVFSSPIDHDSSVYLRLPFPLVIAMFYGYFAQAESIKRAAKEKEKQGRRQQLAAREIQRQRQRLEILHEIDLALTSTMELRQRIDLFLEATRVHLPYAAVILRLRDPESGVLETIASQGIVAAELPASSHPLGCVDEIGESRAPLKVDNAFTDPRIHDVELFRQKQLVSFVEIPMIANDEVLGSLIFLTRQEHAFVEEEVEFLSTVARQFAMAIHHSQLFDQIQRRSDELRQSNKAKDEFLGVVSNELKTPLNAISGYSHMLSEGMLGEITPIQEKALENLSRQSKELHNLIDSLLQVNYIEAARLHAERQEVNFWEFLSELRAFYDYPLGKDVKLVWQFRADLPVLYADRGKLRHILENLINNAVKFTDQGAVTISARNLPAKKLMEFKVTDTGMGIPKELAPSIFERFRQLDSADPKLYGGVGVGLYIVKEYTSLLGGTIQVESKLGQGSVFTLRVPCEPQSSPSAHEQLSFSMEAESLKQASRNARSEC
ncbi:MAG: GAF domain-containing sensor histidine kinase [Candidatus Binatia bacterium]